VTNPTCKNCSYECAADCEHCVTQPSTEQFSGGDGDGLMNAYVYNVLNIYMTASYLSSGTLN